MSGHACNEQREKLLMHLQDHRTNGLDTVWDLKARYYILVRAIEHVEYVLQQFAASENKEALEAIERICREVSEVGMPPRR